MKGYEFESLIIVCRDKSTIPTVMEKYPGARVISEEEAKVEGMDLTKGTILEPIELGGEEDYQDYPPKKISSQTWKRRGKNNKV